MIKRFVINAYEKRLHKEIKQKFAKKGVLIKIFDSNKKRSDSLVEILKESNNLNTLNNSKQNENLNSKIKTEDEFLSKFRNVSKGGPNHSIAINRAHHLTNFLSEYIINAFQSSHFETPEVPDELQNETDLNGFKKDKFYFEISNVKLMSDLSALKIFWFSSENENVNKFIEDFLEKKLKTQIRTTLSSERVMNYVPKIVFLRDDSKVLMTKLDDELMKINLDIKKPNSEYSDENESQELSTKEQVQNKKKIVNNLYGIDIESMVESLKKGGSSDLKVWDSENFKENDVQNTVKQSQKFEASLKAYEINKRIKNERIKKSTLHKIAQLEFEELKEKNFQ